MLGYKKANLAHRTAHIIPSSKTTANQFTEFDFYSFHAFLNAAFYRSPKTKVIGLEAQIHDFEEMKNIVSTPDNVHIFDSNRLTRNTLIK